MEGSTCRWNKNEASAAVAAHVRKLSQITGRRTISVTL